MARRRIRIRTVVAICAVAVLPLMPLIGATAQDSARGGEGCEDVTGGGAGGQRGMTAVTSTSSPNVPVGSKVRISASDRDRPANSRSVVVTVVGKKQLPANICLDLSPEAFKIFDPQGAAYRDAEVEIVSRRSSDPAAHAPDDTDARDNSNAADQPDAPDDAEAPDQRSAARPGGGEGCEDVTGGGAGGQHGMTAITSTSSPNVPVGSKVRISASDRDRPAGSRSIVVTVVGKKQLPANICLDLSPEAFKIFDPQGAAYRDAEVTVVSGG